MLASPLFKSELQDYLGEKMRAAARDRRTFEDRGEAEMALLAAQWQRFYESRLADFTDVYRAGPARAPSGNSRRKGRSRSSSPPPPTPICPLLGLDSSINAQIGQGVATYRKHFSREPAGMWLPECAYRPESVRSRKGIGARRGLEAFLAAHRLKYFFVDGRHLLRQPENPGSYAVGVDRGLGLEGAAQGPGMYGDLIDGDRVAAAGSVRSRKDRRRRKRSMRLYAIHQTGRPGSETAFFIRDTETSQQVWSARLGLPRRPLLPGIP